GDSSCPGLNRYIRPGRPKGLRTGLPSEFRNARPDCFEHTRALRVEVLSISESSQVRLTHGIRSRCSTAQVHERSSKPFVRVFQPRRLPGTGTRTTHN